MLPCESSFRRAISRIAVLGTPSVSLQIQNTFQLHFRYRWILRAIDKLKIDRPWSVNCSIMNWKFHVHYVISSVNSQDHYIVGLQKLLKHPWQYIFAAAIMAISFEVSINGAVDAPLSQAVGLLKFNHTRQPIKPVNNFVNWIRWQMLKTEWLSMGLTGCIKAAVMCTWRTIYRVDTDKICISIASCCV
jgi:hypothetical protein